MGRVAPNQRWVLVAAFAVLHPGLLGLSGWVIDEFGRPATSLTAGLAVAFLLSVGPWGFVPAVVVRCGVVLLGGGGPELVVVTLTETLVWLGTALLLEWSADRHGAVRTTDAIAEFLLIAVIGGPVVAIVLGALLTGMPVDLSAAIGPASGILLLHPGLRVVVMRRLPHFDGRAVAVTTAAMLAYVAAVGTVVRLLPPTQVATQSVALVYIVAAAFLLGYVRYSALLAVGTLLTVTTLALVSTPVEQVSVPALVGATGALAVGLLAANEADRRRDSTTQLAVLFASAATPAAVVRLPGFEVTRANSAMEELVHANHVERPLDEVLHVEPRAAALLTGLAETEGEVELWFRDRAGAWRFGRVTLSRIRRAAPLEDLGLVQLVDLTEVHERAVALERANAALSRLSGRIAHDLRQPLASIVAFAATIDEHVEQLHPDVLRNMTGRLGAAANRAADRLESLAESARMAGEGPVVIRLAAALDEVEQTLELEFEDRDGTLHRDLAEDTVVGDRGAVQAILLNLVGNALKYADSGDGPVVEVRSRATSAGVVVTVRDRGPGIPVESLDRVFERGQRLGTGEIPGTGMGLTDSRDLAESSGGSLVAVPAVGGARFDLRLQGTTDGASVPAVRVLHAEADGAAREQLRALLDLDQRIDHVGSVDALTDLLPAVRHVVPDAVVLGGLADTAGARAILQEALPGLHVVDAPADDLAAAVRRIAEVAREHASAAPSAEQLGIAPQTSPSFSRGR